MQSGHTPDFRIKVTLGACTISVIFFTPFSINLFIQQNWILAFGSLAIITLFSINIWTCAHNKLDTHLTFFVLVPIIISVLAYAFHTAGTNAVFWCFPAVLSFFLMLTERKAWIANIAFLAIIPAQAWLIFEPAFAIRFTIGLILVSGFSAILVRIISVQQETLEVQAITDPLTGLLNRVLLPDTLEHAIKLNHRTNIPMTLVSLDLDHFKRINDEHGHSAGDTVLRGIGEYLTNNIRHSDKVFRLGGEEFLAVLYDTNNTQAQHLATELCHKIATKSFLPENTITASIGIATLDADECVDEWMKRCDDKLYAAKNNGRNQVAY